MGPKPSFSIELPKSEHVLITMEPPPTIESSSPSAIPIRERIASLEALRQEHLRTAAEIGEEVARLQELLIISPSTDNTQHTQTSRKTSLTFSANVQYHDDTIGLVKPASDTQSNSNLAVIIEPAPLHSPLPEEYIRHAGHTPLLRRSPSPKHRSPTAETTPEQYLDGPLTLPIAPGDGSDDGINLRTLGERLADLAKEQSAGTIETHTEEKDKEPDAEATPPERKPSATERKLSPTERKTSVASDRNEVEADGILLKKPQLNFGVPLGQL